MSCVSTTWCGMVWLWKHDWHSILTDSWDNITQEEMKIKKKRPTFYKKFNIKIFNISLHNYMFFLKKNCIGKTGIFQSRVFWIWSKCGGVCFDEFNVVVASDDLFHLFNLGQSLLALGESCPDESDGFILTKSTKASSQYVIEGIQVVACPALAIREHFVNLSVEWVNVSDQFPIKHKSFLGINVFVHLVLLLERSGWHSFSSSCCWSSLNLVLLCCKIKYLKFMIWGRCFFAENENK